jgi:hypothetical protein
LPARQKEPGIACPWITIQPGQGFAKLTPPHVCQANCPGAIFGQRCAISETKGGILGWFGTQSEQVVNKGVWSRNVRSRGYPQVLLMKQSPRALFSCQ